jgi:hypothetical protein
MQKAGTQFLLLVLLLLSSCIDSGVNPEWVNWRSYQLGGRLTVLVPPEWAGPEYSYFEYLGVAFRLDRDQFTFYYGPSLQYWFSRPDLQEYAASPTTIGGRQATLET